MLCCEILDDADQLRDILSGYPKPILDALSICSIRNEVASSLVCAIASVQFDSGEIPINAWRRPHHVTQPLPPENTGLPTGLAISGLLLNVVLFPTDQTIFQFLKCSRGRNRGAFLRFADDMLVFSKSPDGLFALVDEVWRAITGDSRSVLSDQESSNLRLNLAKVGPSGVQEVVNQYLRDQGWSTCTECERLTQDDSGRPNAENKTPRTLTDWWSSIAQVQHDKTHQSLRGAIDRETVGPSDIGPFVTTLVDRLSEIGRDALADRFGEGAHDHAVRLHDLARLDIDDEQVRPDTRRAFAVNRLVKVWVSPNAEDVRQEIQQIRDSVESVLRTTPWKFTLWQAVIRASARRPSTSDSQDDDTVARLWLTRQLGRIADRSVDTIEPEVFNPDVWAQTWPEPSAGSAHDRNPAWRSLYLSYHRAAFWRALATEIRSLWRDQENVVRPPIGSVGLSPERWAARAVPDDRLSEVLVFLAELDQWVAALYPQPYDELDLSSWPWECDQLVAAVLATCSCSTLAKSWLQCEQPDDLLVVPEQILSTNLPRTAKILRRCGRLQPSGQATHSLTTQALAGIYLGHGDQELGDFLFPSNGQYSRIDESEGSVHLLAMAVSLGCSASVPTGLVSKVIHESGILAKPVQVDALTLREYGQLRRILLSRQGGLELWRSKQPTLHRLLWGVVSDGDVLRRWQPRPWEVPAVGLPTVLSVCLFESVQHESLPPDSEPADGPFTWIIRRGQNFLSHGRRCQFGTNPVDEESKRYRIDVSRSSEWEAPPHPAYFLPLINSGKNSTSPRLGRGHYALYCDVLLFLTALDGGESILHTLLERGAGSVPFRDRWGWRSRIHLPNRAWEVIEQVIRLPERIGLEAAACLRARLLCSLRDLSRKWLCIEHCYSERVDIRLETTHDIEVARAITTQGTAGEELPTSLYLNLKDPDLADDLIVRICQVTEHPERSSVDSSFPVPRTQESQRIMEQVAGAFKSAGRAVRGRSPDLVVMPEVSIPISEVRTIRRLVETEGRASLAGLYWRVLKPAYSVPNGSAPARCWMVNEAELVIPVGHGMPGPTSSRWFRVRKLVTAHMEKGLERALSKGNKSTWTVLGGHRWYRFLHPNWGDFSISICADLLDARQWRSLRGELLHLFVVEFNKDIELYQSLTWVRAYETYVNLISVNHGKYGGSFVWTPQRRYSRELASIRGRGLFLMADIEVPVRGLVCAQDRGPNCAIRIAENTWLGCNSLETAYKSPPPGYKRKCISDG